MKAINFNLVWHPATEKPEVNRHRISLLRRKDNGFLYYFETMSDPSYLGDDREVVAWAYLPEPEDLLADILRATYNQNFDYEWINLLYNNATK